MAQIELSSLVGLTQSHIAKNYAAALIDKSKTAELKAYIGKYLYDTGYSVAGYDTKGLVERLFTEMAEYSILTKHLADPDLEEININGWDDVALTHLDGRIEKAEEHFFSPQHAIDIVKKLLHHSGMIIDNAAPIAQGHLPNNTRVTALKEPIVDADRGIAVSIRMLHPQRVDRNNLIETDSLTDDMLARRNNKRKKLDSSVTERGKYSAKYALTELLVCGSCGGSFRRTSKCANGKTTYYWRCVSRIEHGKTYCKDSAGIEERVLHEAVCRCLSKMMENSGEVLTLIQSNLSYAVSGNNTALDVFSIEKQMNDLKVDIQQMTELAARTEGDPERYEIELKKMFDQLVVLRGKLDLAKSQASQSDSVNAEVARIMEVLKQTDMNFTEFDDVTVRRLVECIQVCGNQKIVVTLKGGYQAEELLKRIDAVA